MHNHFTYRKGTSADQEQIRQLAIRSYGQFESVLSPQAFQKMYSSVSSNEMWTALLQVSTAFVCVHKDQLIGMAFIIPGGNPWDIFLAEWSYIRMVGVDPAWQGKGIAKQLTQRCIDHAKKNNEQTVALHTSEFMPAARHIYENLGFKILKEIEPRYEKKYWLYTLDLRESSSK